WRTRLMRLPIRLRTLRSLSYIPINGNSTGLLNCWTAMPIIYDRRLLYRARYRISTRQTMRITHISKKNERGVTILIVGITLLVLISMAALAIDVASL